MSFAGNHFLPALRRFWPLVLAMFAGTVLGAHVLVALDLASLNLLVGIFVVVFCLSSHVNPAMRLPNRYEAGAGVVAGGIGGFMGGLSALFGPPLIMYFASLRLDRDTFVGVISSIYLCCSVTLVVVFGSVGVMSRAQFAESTLACVPLLIGVWVGRRFRGRIDEELFRKLLLVALLAVGVRLIAIGLGLMLGPARRGARSAAPLSLGNVPPVRCGTRGAVQRGPAASAGRQPAFRSMTLAPLASARRAGAIANTLNGLPAAAQISSNRNRSASMNTSAAVACPRGGTPPIANPVAARTKLASARPTASPIAAASLSGSRRLSPLMTAITGRSPARNTSDFAISPTEHPTAAAASTAVRVESGRVRISHASDAASRAARTRSGPFIFAIASASDVSVRSMAVWADASTCTISPVESEYLTDFLSWNFPRTRVSSWTRRKWWDWRESWA